jgi:hypothetical protein
MGGHAGADSRAMPTGTRLLAVTYVYLCYTDAMRTRSSRPRRGRPAHLDDPPVMVGTTIPSSINKLLKELSVRLGRPRSELLADAIRAYARRFAVAEHMKK